MFARLLGQRVHEIRVHPRKDRARRFQRAARLFGAVHASDRRERAIAEALHADRKPVHAGGAIAAKPLHLEGARVRLHRDLRRRIDRDARADAGEQAVDRLGCEEARRAAAHEDRVEAPAPHRRQARLEIGQ